MDNIAAHVLVLDHVRPHLFRSSSEVDPDTGEHLEEPRETGAAVAHMGGGQFQEVAHACSCGDELTPDPDKVQASWARHAAKATGLAAKVLVDHPVVTIRGLERAQVMCACASVFEASDQDPTDPGGALQGWAKHLTREALA